VRPSSIRSSYPRRHREGVVGQLYLLFSFFTACYLAGRRC
jgi:hypothetical protein